MTPWRILPTRAHGPFHVQHLSTVRQQRLQ